MSSWTTVKVTEVDPYISVLTMNRPEQRNAINAAMADELEACLVSLKDKPDLRVLIVTGEGTAFGAGADLKERAILTPEQTQKARDAVLRFIEMIEAFRAPVIAMINGPAIAGTFEIALACDIRVASDRANFSLPEVNKVGAFPGAGGPVRLPRAKQLILKSNDLDLQSAMKLSRALRDPMDGTAAATEGIQAWADKRRPDFARG